MHSIYKNSLRKGTEHYLAAGLTEFHSEQTRADGNNALLIHGRREAVLFQAILFLGDNPKCAVGRS